MRPNYAQDPPPTSLAVGGAARPINADYAVWIEIGRRMGGLLDDVSTPERAAHNLQLIGEMETLAFGAPVAPLLKGGDAAKKHGEALARIADFYRGYPEASTESGGERLYSFDCDLNDILVAMRVQYGVDLSWRRREPFHWWEFLLLFRSLCGDHRFLRTVEARAYRGSDPEMKRRRSRCALPQELSGEEALALEAINREFDGA